MTHSFCTDSDGAFCEKSSLSKKSCISSRIVGPNGSKLQNQKIEKIGPDPCEPEILTDLSILASDWSISPGRFESEELGIFKYFE